MDLSYHIGLFAFLPNYLILYISSYAVDICILVLEKCLFKSFAYFFNCYFFLLLDFRSSLNILILSLSDVQFGRYFLLSMSCLFTLLIVLLQMFIFDVFLFIFYCLCFLCHILRNAAKSNVFTLSPVFSFYIYLHLNICVFNSFEQFMYI